MLTLTPYNDFFNDAFDTILTRSKQIPSYTVENDELIMSFDVPGFSKKDLNISVEDCIIHIKGNTDTREISKTFRVGTEWDLSKTNATVESGVLNITVPKFEERKKKFIEIKVK
jgi:HSP20 family protein